MNLSVLQVWYILLSLKNQNMTTNYVQKLNSLNDIVNVQKLNIINNLVLL